LRVAAVQLNSTADKAANLAAADRLTRAAAADGARLIVLPEKWTAIGDEHDLRAAAEDLDGEALAWARGIARELDIEMIAGSITESREGHEKLSNTSVHIDTSGETRAIYRKIHMFDVEVDGRAYEESAAEEAGDEVVVSETAEGVQLGLSICYDLRFPELYRILTLMGARVLVLPGAFTLATTRDHWETLLRARAIENQCFVVAANQIGAHPGGHRSGGRSMIIDPWGVVLAAAPDREGHIACELELEDLAEIRRQLPSLANRRAETYKWPEAVSR
jgi:deaminated glutathione amidase